jgi:tetratricopeptide (TPR) repeat protein
LKPKNLKNKYSSHEGITIVPLIAPDEANADSLNNIGSAYNLNDTHHALQYFEEVLRIYRALQNIHGEAETLTNIGTAQRRAGKHKQALISYRKSLPLWRKIGNRQYEALTLSSMGVVYGDMKVFDKALKYHNRALTIRRSVGDRPGEALTLHNIGFVREQQGDLEEAQLYYKQSLSINRSTGSPDLKRDKQADCEDE